MCQQGSLQVELKRGDVHTTQYIPMKSSLDTIMRMTRYDHVRYHVGLPGYMMMLQTGLVGIYICQLVKGNGKDWTVHKCGESLNKPCLSEQKS